MDAHETLKNARKFILRQGGKLAPLALSEEEIDPTSQEDISYQAYALENTTCCYPVEYKYPDDCGKSEFSFFEDGRQRTVHIGYIKADYGTQTVMIPVHYVVVAAVIIERQDNRLKLWEFPEIRHGILVEKSLVPDQKILE